MGEVLMTDRILVAYATRAGSTTGVAEAIAAKLREQGAAVDVQLASDVGSLEGYTAAVIGAPIYVGAWLKDAHKLLEDHQAALAGMPVAVFALGPVHDTEEEFKAGWESFDKALAEHPWLQPVAKEVFVGAFDASKLGFFWKLLLKLPASPLKGATAEDNRDWDAIDKWAEGTYPALD
jgi:menaquinone-dependent protoporphyrinogen oxidase